MSDKIWIPSGSTMLNLAMTGELDKAFQGGRFYNIVGAPSTGKTLLATETLTAAYYRAKKLGKKLMLVYNDAEAAFNMEHAKAIHCPVDEIEFIASDSLEEFYFDFDDRIKKIEEGEYDGMVYILDTLDAVTTQAEKKRKITEDTYGTEKPKLMSLIFRRIDQAVEQTNTILIIISQIRDKIGVTYGRKWDWSGGRALRFYASSILILSELERIKKSIGNFERIVGVRIGIQVEKNKQWKPFRNCAFPILFNYGIDDLSSCVDFLIETGVIQSNKGWYVSEPLFETDKKFRYEDMIKFIETNQLYSKIKELVKEKWDELERLSNINRQEKWSIVGEFDEKEKE